MAKPKIIQTIDDHKADDVVHIFYTSATGSANTYAVTLTPAPTSYVNGLAVSAVINVDSTGASTLNVNGLGAKSIKKANGTDVTNLKTNGVYTFRYNAATGNFILQGEGASGNAVASDLLSGKTAGTDAGDIVGTMANRGAVTITPSIANQTIAAGYHNGSGTVTGDADLVAGNIKSGINIFGIAGNVTALTNERKWATGTATANSSGILTVNGLSFTPAIILTKITYATGTHNGIAAYVPVALLPGASYDIAVNTGSSSLNGIPQPTMSYGSFSIQVIDPNASCGWMALS